MRTFKSVFGVISALGPVLYCGGLLYFFFDQAGGSVQQAEDMGLGPTLIGLGVVGLLFCIPLLYKIMRLITGPRSPRSGGDGGPSASTGDEESGFDADAVIARYMARQTTEAAPNAPAISPTRPSTSPAKRQGFGRKIR